MKNYFLVLLSVLGIGILIDNINSTNATPNMAVSSEVAQVNEMPVLSKIEDIPTTSLDTITTTAKITTSRAKTSGSTSAASSTSSIPTYRVTPLTTVKSKDLSYSQIYKTNKFVYGHNSSNLLGGIRSFGAGSIFNITEGTNTTTYQVQEARIFYKSSEYTLELCNSGYDDCTGGTYYINSFVNGNFRGQTYDVVLFTCDGTNLGGGDATHRRVVFATKA